jgi:helix-turn-helix protein
MPHANAPLAKTGGLRLTRCVVDDGWLLRRAAERFQVSVSCAQRWADRYRTHGEAPARAAHPPAPNAASSKSAWPAGGTSLRLYLVCAPAGMPMLWALADPQLGEREVLAARLEVDAEMINDRAGPLLIRDKGFASKEFERSLSEQDITLLRPSRKCVPQEGGDAGRRAHAEEGPPAHRVG